MLPELEDFTEYFQHCVKTRRSRAHMKAYIASQLSRQQRRSVERIALKGGLASRTLQRFLPAHRRDEEVMVDCRQRRIRRQLGKVLE